MFLARDRKNRYLCQRYPEYNLFTLKKLIPIEIECLTLRSEGIFCLFTIYKSLVLFPVVAFPRKSLSDRPAVKLFVILYAIGLMLFVGFGKMMGTIKIRTCTHIKIIMMLIIEDSIYILRIGISNRARR